MKFKLCDTLGLPMHYVPITYVTKSGEQGHWEYVIRAADVENYLKKMGVPCRETVNESAAAVIRDTPWGPDPSEADELFGHISLFKSRDLP
jgi:hypothetical protein